MKHTIKLKDLNDLIKNLNDYHGEFPRPWDQQGGQMVANVGNYHLSRAYGGFNVNQMANERGGCSEPAGHGHVSKKECFARIRSLFTAARICDLPKGR